MMGRAKVAFPNFSPKKYFLFEVNINQLMIRPLHTINFFVMKYNLRANQSQKTTLTWGAGLRLIGLMTLLSCLFVGQLSAIELPSGVAFVHSETISPSGNAGNPAYPYRGGALYDDYETSMNTVFGVGNWDDLTYESVDPNQLFSNAFNTIYMEGSDQDAIAFNNFIAANLSLIESWVFGGGQLLMNASPSVGGNIDMGFGGVGITFPSISLAGVANDPAHPIFNGPNMPTLPFSGGLPYGLAVICPPGMNVLIASTALTGSRPILMESDWGEGRVLFGGMHPSSNHGPQPHAFNIKANILEYLASSASITNDIVGDSSVCQGGTNTYSVAQGIGEVYVWETSANGTIVGSNTGASIEVEWAMTPSTSEYVRVFTQTPSATTQIVVDFDTQCYDLDAPGSSAAPCMAPSDLSVTASGPSTPDADFVLEGGAQYAFITGADFDNVTRCDADTSTFSALAPDSAATAEGVFIILTAAGNYYKVGNAVASMTNLTFDYAQLSDNCMGGDSCTLDVVIEDDINLACNDLLHVSLDEECMAILTPDMLLEGDQVYPNSSFTIEIYDQDGNVVPNAILDGSYLGQTLEFRVGQICTGTTCWGNLIVEDKLIPALTCRDTVIEVMCGESTDPEDIGFPLDTPFTYTRIVGQNEYVVSGFDPCGDVWLRFEDEVVKNGCGFDYYTMITRSWEVEDAAGNKTSCVEEIGIIPGSFSNVTFPPDFNGFDKFSLECDDRGVVTKSQPVGGVNIGWNPLANGHPSPYDNVLNANDTLIGTGFPSGVTCEHLAVSYKDRIIETCGQNTYKLFREWKVYDWCTGEDSIHIQSIKVVDTKAPEVICPTTTPVVVPTDPWTCTGSFIVEDPIFDPFFRGVANVPVILKECNDYTYQVRHKIASVGTMSPDECADVDESETFFTTNVRQLPNGKFEIFDMPQGCNWIKYIITDDCGNKIECGLEVFVQDTENPVAVCDEHTVVSLNEAGEAKLCAPVVDNGSQDNCTEQDSLVFEIKKMGESDALFRDCIDFTCADVAISPIMVVFRVYDKAGNYNDCMVEVTIQDKIPPSIECPPAITLNCDQDYLDDVLTGIPTVSDQCGGANLTSSIVVEDLNDCGIGYVIKRWRVEDNSGRFAVCDQRIDLIDPDPFDGNDIIWPQNYTLNGCELIDAHPNNLPIANGYPRYRNEDCAKPVAGYDDEAYYNIDGYCIKIFRTWEVIDWCQYDLTTGNGGRWTFVQTIYVVNNEAPVIVPGTCEGQYVCADADCNGLIETNMEATDDCTASEDLEWNYVVRDGNGDVIQTGLGPNFSEVYPRGRYSITWTVKDACGNETTCTSDWWIRDCKEPTPYCKPGIVTTIMPSAGYVDIWASDFNDASFDNCTDTSDLRFSFSEDLTDIVRRVSCDSLNGQASDTFTYRMYVTDLDGNFDYCVVTIIVQDNQGVCGTTSALVAVGGEIYTEDNDMMEGVEVELLQSKVHANNMMTANDGKFGFNGLEMAKEYSIKPTKNDDHLNGVSTADIVMIQRYLLGKQDLDSPYKLIAADVNGTNTISASDIATIRKLILGKISEFPKVNSWRFIDAGHQFTDANDPWLDPFFESVDYSPLMNDEMATNFVALKVGDVTGDAQANGLKDNGTREQKWVELVTENRVLAYNELTQMDFHATTDIVLNGFQMTFELRDFTFENLSSDFVNLSMANYYYNEESNVLTVSYDSEEEVALAEGQVIFTVAGYGHMDMMSSQAISLTSSVTKAEVYLEDLQVADLTLKFASEAGNEDAEGMTLYQNIPNPFQTSTVIPFELPKDAPATLTVFDVTGKVQFVIYLEGRAGYNEFELNVDQLTKSGVLYYQLESNQQVATKRMLLLNR